MRRTAALVGSIGMHGVLAIALASIAHDRVVVPAPASPTIALVEVTLAAPPAPPADAGGGAPAAQPATAAIPRPRSIARPRRDPVARRAITTTIEPVSSAPADPGGDRGDGAGTGGDGGDGGGTGGGHGTGIGLGEGAGIELPELPPPPPPPPPAAITAISKARPAKLIYPARNREVADGELFIARVIVDHEGYVVGAKLVRGFGGHADDQAANLIWRFRYAPALDDAGRPVRSTVDQRFLVER